MNKLSTESIIAQLKNTNSLIDGSLIADSLKSILVGLCDLVTQQQQEMSNLKELISKSTPIDTYNTSINDLTKQIQDTKVFCTTQFSQISSNFTNIKDNVITPMHNILVQNQADFQNKASELEKSLNNQTNLVFEQCSAITKNQKEQINQIMLQLENLNKDYLITKTTVEELKVIDSHAIDKRLSAIDKTVKETEKKISELSAKEEKFEKYVNDQIQNEYNKNFSKLFEDLDELKQLQGSRKVSSQEIKINDPESLILAVERNSRRLDGVDQIISGIKLDYSNTKDIISTYRTVLITFKESLYEISTDNDESQRTVSKKLSKISEFINFLSNHMNQIYDFISTLSKYQLNLSESSSKGFDQLKSIFHLITKITIPEFNFLYQSIDDQFTFHNQLSQTIINDDIEGYMKAFSDAFKTKNKKGQNYTQRIQPKDVNSNKTNILNTPNTNSLDNNSDQASYESRNNQNVIKQENDLNKSNKNTSNSTDTVNTTNNKDEYRLQSLVKRISNYDIPNLSDVDVQISIKNVDSIKDLFFRAEPIRLQLIDLRSKIDILSKSVESITSHKNDETYGIISKINEKADVDYVARAFEKTNKAVRSIRDDMNNIKRTLEFEFADTKIDKRKRSEDAKGIVKNRVEPNIDTKSDTDIPLSQLSLSVAGVAANAAANARFEGAAGLVRESKTRQNASRIQGARTQLASMSPPGKSKGTTFNQPPLLKIRSTGRYCGTISKSSLHQQIGKSSGMSNGNKNMAKSAEISPREKLKMEERMTKNNELVDN